MLTRTLWIPVLSFWIFPLTLGAGNKSVTSHPSPWADVTGTDEKVKGPPSPWAVIEGDSVSDKPGDIKSAIVNGEDLERLITCPNDSELDIGDPRMAVVVARCMKGGIENGPHIRWIAVSRRLEGAGTARAGAILPGRFIKEEEGRYRLGRKVGTWTKWPSLRDMSGPKGGFNLQKYRATSVENFDENGHKTGKSEGWHVNGNKRSEAIYKADKLINLMSWDPNGNKKEEFRNGVLTRFYPDGTKQEEGRSEEGQREIGAWTIWFPNGQKKSLGEFKDGGKKGPWTFWYENGNKSAEGRFAGAGDTKTGEWRYWYEDGTKHSVTQEHASGLELYWYENGQIARKGRVVGGSACGKYECWDLDGRPIPCGEWKDLKLTWGCKMTDTGAFCSLKCGQG